MKVKSGNVLMVVLVFMALIALLTEQFIANARIDRITVRNYGAREQGELLCMSGFALAHAQFRAAYTPQKARTAGATDKKPTPTLDFVTGITPLLGKWQKYELTEAVDGVDAVIGIYITAESGKIPLQTVYDPKKKALKPSVAEVLSQLKIKKKKTSESGDGDSPRGGGGENSSSDVLGQWYAKRFGQKKEEKTGSQGQQESGAREAESSHPVGSGKGVLCDISECASLCDTWGLSLFPSFDRQTELAFSDYFTLWRPIDEKVSVYSLAPGVESLIGMKKNRHKSPEQEVEFYQQCGQSLSQSGLDILKRLGILYPSSGHSQGGSQTKLSSRAQELFSSEIEHRFYSVLSYASVSGVEVQSFGILEYIPAKLSEKKDGKEQPDQFVMRRLFLI